MSERLLKALMQLFAIVADVEDVTNKSRGIVELFLNQQLNQDQVQAYMQVYDEYLEVHHKISKKKEGKRKRTSVNSVKVLRICTQINEELTQKQKMVVVMRILEYLLSDMALSEQEMEFASTVAETFNIPNTEFHDLIALLRSAEDGIPNSNLFLQLHEEEPAAKAETRYLYAEGLNEDLLILHLESVGMFVLKYLGASELLLNGQILYNNRAYIFTQGSSMRSSRVQPIYYSDVVTSFLSDRTDSKIVFTADNLEFEFKGGKKGLNPLTFQEEGGKLVGIMGGSGTGKSTLLFVLNGTNVPSKGSVTINGIDIHHEKDQLEGVIGFVPQDDLLIEELTVFQNLYYNTKLCFDHMSDEEITTRVDDLLVSLGLFETRDLKVGSPLEKTISGGQRKRLNIGLELIREPAVLFCDEPTSGLSSRDSENIMDLLKELALKGKQVYVVIHQPSSDIFKMFDKLMILDVGGFPVYYGNPVDAVIYFKSVVKHVKATESECPTCGNVNPEQIFNILEAKVLDEFGNLTPNRKILPKQWNDLYTEQLPPHPTDKGQDNEVPKSTFKVPNVFKQFGVFITRDVLSKLTNKQYLFINLVEAPALALLLAVFVKFRQVDVGNQIGYIFRDNENLPAYMFMAVIVALFMGLTVSAEEIIRDQKIRRRESFLNLSNGSYLFSKIAIMFTLSAVQTLSYILVGNLVMGIEGMFLDYWLVLFTTACFANMLGLNISATFNSAVTIYISIPILLIPQLLFSGVIVKFDKLNPMVTSQEVVPVIGDAMASRWAFEALAVNQFRSNEFEDQFYDINKALSVSNYKKNFWIPALKSKLGFIENNLADESKAEEVETGRMLLVSEIGNELTKVALEFDEYQALVNGPMTKDVIEATQKFLKKLNRLYIGVYNDKSDHRDNIIRDLHEADSPEGKEQAKQAFIDLKNHSENESLSDLVRNSNELNQIIEVDGKLIQRADPVYQDPDGFRAHFYAPRKKFAGRYYSTFWANISVLWIMSIFLAITLYFDAFKRLGTALGRLSERLR